MKNQWIGGWAVTAIVAASAVCVSSVWAAAPDFQEWHNKTEAENMAAIESARKQGYRVESVAVYGNAGNERFATVVVRGTGETATQKVEMRSLAVPVNVTQADTGWNIRKIAASGNRAIVVLESGGINSIAIGAPDAKAFAARNDEKLRTVHRLVSMTAYKGSGGGTSYFGVWEPNVRNVGWNADVLDAPVADAQTHYNAMAQTGVRLALAGYTPTGSIYQVWADDDLGRCDSRAELTTAQLEQEMGKHYGQGFAPVSISAYSKDGSSNPASARFAVIWAPRLRPATPDFVATGAGAKGGAPIPEIDEEVKKFMVANGMHSVSLAVCAGTQLVYARSYSLGGPAMTLDTTFRQASCQKPFTAAAIYRLVQTGRTIPGTQTKITLDTKLQDILHLKTPDGKEPTDKRFNDITLRHLIAHRSGLRSGAPPYKDPAPTAECLAIDYPTADAFHKSLPITPEEGASYIASLTMHEAPSMSAGICYNNSNTFLLGLVCAKMLNKTDSSGHLDAFAALQQLIFQPLGLKTVQRTRVSFANQPTSEALYLPRVLTAIDPGSESTKYVNAHLGFTYDITKSDTPLAPSGYGEYNLENWVGPGGTSMSALDCVRLAAALADPEGGGIFTKEMRETFLTDCTSGGRYAFDGTAKHADGSYNGNKGGSLPTSGNTLYFETNGVSFSINGSGQTAYGPGFYPSNPVILAAINKAKLQNVNLWEANGYKPISSTLIKFPLPKFPQPISVRDLNKDEPFAQPVLLPGRRRNP